MQVKWYTDCKTPEQKAKRKEYVEGAQGVLDILKKICYNSTLAQEQSISYSDPNWALKQADLVGYKRALEEIIKMCTFDSRNH